MYTPDFSPLCSKTVLQYSSNYVFSAVSNHGVSEDLIQEQFEENKKFFALPLEEKLKIKVQVT